MILRLIAKLKNWISNTEEIRSFEFVKPEKQKEIEIEITDAILYPEELN